MTNPFANRAIPLSGPATDIVPVAPNDSQDLANVALGLYIETGGALSFQPVNGPQRIVNVTDFSILPVGAVRVMATGTTAAGIHALVLA